MEASSSSKVTVEYHDPSGVFQLVAPDISSHLPLRNLNWQTASRPLRLIKSLHVEFVPDEFTQGLSRPELQRLDSHGTGSIDIIRSGAQTNRAVKERRHQIPGLRQTPYLKIYLLRCDDKDAYKAAARKHLRDWIRDNTSSSENAPAKGGREDHDTCEWLIVHVVLPDTQEATEPRWRPNNDEKTSDEFKERPAGKSKWPGRSTRTVFDKLRADFNSSKSAPDRVAQIRLQKDKVRLAEILPGAPVFENYVETPKEQEEAWNDLMNKIKILILIPFDLRVRQYEDDIAEKDAQRSLPGWNFCTFFILKEGLARGLESVGLVEDALAIYDELNLGLETVIRDLAAGITKGSATVFSSYTDDIKQRILQSTSAEASNGKPKDQALGLFNKDYREKIVTSKISIFDFFCYLFSRQKALLLRMGRARSSQVELNGGIEGSGLSQGEDLTYFAEVCKRALTFIHTNSRILRQDLRNGTESIHSRESDINVENLASSWAYSVASLVLDETRTPHLQASDTMTNGLTSPSMKSLLNGGQGKAEFKFAMGADPYPQRSSSLPMQKSRTAPELQSPPSSQVIYEDGVFSPPPSRGNEKTGESSARPGLADLASCRAELLVTQRKVLELLAKRRAWYAGWAAVKEARSAKMDEIDLNGDSEASDVAEGLAREIERSSKLLSSALESTLKTVEEFRQTYESLSDLAVRHYLAAGHMKAAETVMGDLAMVKYQTSDYANAATYFQHVLPFYADEKWSYVEAEALSVYAKCLKELHRKDEHVRTIVSILAKVCAKKIARKLPRLRLSEVTSEVGWFDDGIFDVAGYLPELIAYSEGLPYDVTANMETYFSDIQLKREVEHYEGKDGFMLRLRFRHVLDDEIELDQVSVRLVHVDEPSQEIWLVQGGPLEVAPGITELELESTATTFGPYLVDKVVMKAKRLRFVHELQPTPAPEQTALGITNAEGPPPTQPLARPFVFLYPPKEAFNVEMSLTKSIHIDKPRSIELCLSSGWNDIESIDLRLKPASAGLRLHIADLMLTGLNPREDEPTKPGTVKLGTLSPQSSAKLVLPYTLENQPQDVTIRLEARYHTSKGSFVFISSVKIPIELSLDVDVHDIFHHSTLFSNFSVRTTTRLPLSVTHAQLEESAVYAVEGPPVLPMPMTVMDRQPVRLMYKISRNSLERASASKKDAALALTIRYQCLDELIHDRVVRNFSDALNDGEHGQFERLLVPLLRQRVCRVFDPEGYERILSFEDARIPSFEELGWEDVVFTLPAGYRQGLMEWLHSWHDRNSHISPPIEKSLQDSSNVERSITISVDVPNIDVVHSASLDVTLKRTSKYATPIVALGKTIGAQLRIKHSRRWSTTSIFGASKASADGSSKPLDFTFEVLADADTWLLAGQRRARFSAIEDEVFTFELTLIPLKLGTHLLPVIEIQPVPTDPVSGENAQQIKTPSITCETNYQSSGEVLRVINDIRTTTLRIADAAEPAGLMARPSTASAREGG